MAFVYKSANISKEGHPNIGPGSYNFQDLFQSRTIGFAPFASTVDRFSSQSKTSNKIIKPEYNIPGPGAYTISKDLVSDKILVSNIQNDMKIIEVPKESSVFKSKTEKLEKRLETKDITPGPGSYLQEKPLNDFKTKCIHTPSKEFIASVFLSTNEAKMDKKHNTISLIDDLKKSEMKYKIIPSIPGQKEAFGYTESDSRELQLNNNPLIKFSGLGDNSIGPGQYEAKDAFDLRKNKGYSWWKSNTKRIAAHKSQTQEILGPGCYNPSLDIRDLYKTKPTSAFLSKFSRVEDNKVKYHEVLQKKIKEKGMKKQSGDEEHHYIISAFEEQLLKNQMNELILPGPGQYHNEKLRSSLNISTNPVEKQNFGSSDIRFKDDNNLTVGPGDYNPKNDIKTRRIRSRVNIPFISGIKRFEQNMEIAEMPGPGSYNTQQNLENELIKKIQNGYKGNFGALVKRFDDKKELEKNMEIPGPGHYISIDNGEKRPEKNKSCVFKSKSQRNAFNNEIETPGIGTYELDYYNLNNSLNKNLIYEPFVIVKKPPFNSSEPRFVQGFSINKETQSSDSQIKGDGSSFSLGGSIAPKNNTNQIYKKNIYEKNTKFNVKEQRFNYKTEKTPGPGDYSDTKVGNNWNKKTFNILFAEL